MRALWTAKHILWRYADVDAGNRHGLRAPRLLMELMEQMTKRVLADTAIARPRSRRTTRII